MTLPPFRLPLTGETVGEYRVLGALAQGGQGHVLKAECRGEFYVLKFISAREVEPWGEREVACHIKFKHPHVARLVGYGRWPDPKAGNLFLAMEYVEGMTLAEHAVARNPSARWATRSTATVARTLAAAHTAGVLHRDIKPGNILIRASDGEPVLVDFGLAHIGGGTSSFAKGHMVGTEEYVSPQVFRFLQENPEWVDPASPTVPADYKVNEADEQWALGITLYWLLADVHPFGSARTVEFYRGVLRETPVAPHVRNPRCPKALSDVCMRLLEKDPAARFPHMRAVAEALEAALAQAAGDASWEVPLMDSEVPIPGGMRVARGQRYEPEFPASLLNRSGGSVEDSEDALGPSAIEELALKVAAAHPSRDFGEFVPVPPKALEPAVAAEAPSRPSTEQGLPPPPVPMARKSGPWLRALSVVLPSSVGAVPVRSVVVGGVLERLPVAIIFLLVGGMATAFLLRGRPTHPAHEPPATSPAALSTEAPAPVKELAPLLETPQPPASAEASPGPQTPAPVAEAATPKEQEKSVKPDKKRTPPKAQPTLEQCVAAAAAGLLLTGCPTSPAVQVPQREEPPPEACPPRAKDTMLKLGMLMGRPEIVFLEPDMEWVPVREGSATVRLGRPWGKLPYGTLLGGKWIFGQGRIYGRFTTAQTPEGVLYSVCLNRIDDDGSSGQPLRPGESPKVPLHFSTFRLRAVERFP